MIPRSGKSRRQLDFSISKSTDDNGWRLVFPDYYARLFSLEEPKLMEKSNTGWRDSKKEGLKFAFFKAINDRDVSRIKAFVDVYKQLIILELNKHIKNEFNNELDFCVALDWPAEHPDDFAKGKRSRIGECVYLSKYKKKWQKADELATELSKAFKRIAMGKMDSPISISFVPGDNYEEFYLPKYLAEKLAADGSLSHLLDSQTPFVQARIIFKLNRIKDISIKAKLHVLKELYAPEKVTLATSVNGRNIVIIDDLYQSGTTIWSYARLLKNMGANQVFGLVCEKNFRDSDNL